MPLAISRAAGESFWLNSTEVRVVKVHRSGHFILEVGEDAFEIVDDRAEEIAPDVFVSAGDKGHPQQARISIDAPRDIKISRAHPKIPRDGSNAWDQADG